MSPGVVADGGSDRWHRLWLLGIKVQLLCLCSDNVKTGLSHKKLRWDGEVFLEGFAEQRRALKRDLNLTVS